MDDEDLLFFGDGPRRRSDPFLGRLGALVLAGVLLAPVAAALGNDDPEVVTAPSGAAAVMVGPLRADSPERTAALAAPTTGATVNRARTSAATNRIRSTSTQRSSGASATPTTARPTTVTPQTVTPTTVARLAAAPTAVTTSTSCDRRYTARAGDFWIGIADRAGVSLRVLLQANGARVTTPIYPGSRICLPAGANNPGPPPTAAPSPAPTNPAPRPTPTTRPPAPTTPPAPRPPASYSRDEVLAIIREVWPDNLEERAIQIAWRESNWIPTAHNYCCHGLFQIYFNVHRGWLGWFGVTNAEGLYNPRINAMAAYYLYQRAGGWGPWGG